MSQRPRQSNRNRTLAAAGSVLALGGLGYYLYTQWASSSSSSSAAGPSSKGGLAASKRSGPRPTLSLSLPANFLRNKQNVALVAALLLTLSQDFVVTILAPPPYRERNERRGVNGFARAKGQGPVHSDAEDAEDMQSVAQLADDLGGIDGFDSRRVLEYSKEDGRLALIRALGCDAHCEVMLEAMAPPDRTHLSVAQQHLFDNEDDGLTGVDGDVTPRAASPARPTPMHPPPLRRHHSREDVEGERRATMLERYHAEMAKIRKSSSLLVFLLLPVGQVVPESLIEPLTPTSPAPTTPTKGTHNTTHTRSPLDMETILRPFLMPGQRDLSSRVPGVKVIDCRLLTKKASRDGSVSPRSDGTSPKAREGTDLQLWQAWREGAVRLSKFAVGWS